MVGLKAPRDLRGMHGVGTNGGRPVGTTAEKGYGISTSGGRPVSLLTDNLLTVMIYKFV